jgi:hypothetical protein
MNSTIKRIMMIAVVLLPLVLTTACHAGSRRGGSYVVVGWSPPFYTYHRPYRVVRTKPVKARHFKRARRNSIWMPGHYSPNGRWIRGHWMKAPPRGGRSVYKHGRSVYKHRRSVCKPGRSVWRPGRYSPGGIWFSGYWSR